MEFYKALWNANKDEILNFINAQWAKIGHKYEFWFVVNNKNSF